MQHTVLSTTVHTLHRNGLRNTDIINYEGNKVQKLQRCVLTKI
jgi:hypothetical protein